MEQPGLVVRIKKLPHYDEDISLPIYQTYGSAGMDVCVCLRRVIHEYDGYCIDRCEPLKIPPNTTVKVPTGLAVEVPRGYELQIRPRSSLSLHTDLIMPNAPGTIDSDYRGEIHVILRNVGTEVIELQHGTRVAQFVFAPVTFVEWDEVDQLSETARGTKGFGSTGGY